MTGGRNILRAVLAALPILLAATLALTLRPKVEGSLFAITGDFGGALPPVVRDYGSTQIQLLCQGVDAAESHRLAETVCQNLPSNEFTTIRLKADLNALGDCLDFYTNHPAGLVSTSTIRRLQSPEGRAAYARNSILSIFSTPVPPLIPPSQDPFGLLGGFLSDLPRQAAGWQLDGGYLCSEAAGPHTTLVLLTLPGQTLGDHARLIRIVGDILDICRKLQTDTARILPCGVPIHTARTAETCQKDLQTLTLLSSALILIISIIALRTPRHLPAILLALLTAAAGGFCGLALFHKTIHILAPVFGSALLGLTIDYAFHRLLSGHDQSRTVRSMLLSFATTQATFLPLICSGIPLLEQIAIFMGCGLTCGVLSIFLLLPAAAIQTVRVWEINLPKPILWVLALAIAIPLPTVRFRTNLTAIYRPEKTLQQAEQTLQKIAANSTGDRGILLVEAPNLESALQKEEQLDLPPDIPRLSLLIPSLARRDACENLVHKLLSEQQDNWQKTTGLPIPKRPRPRPWNPQELPQSIAAYLLAAATPTQVATLIPSAPQRETYPDGVHFYAPRRLLLEWLGQTAQRVEKLLALVLLATLVLLIAVCRKRAGILLIPSLLAILGVFASLAWRPQPVSLFHLLACFMVLGMSLDYSIFLSRGGKQAIRPVLCSLATSLAGFGTLVWVDFPLVKAIGETLALGLSIGCLSAFPLFRREPARTEQSASPLGLWLAWMVYKILGKTALDLVGNCIAWCVWVGNPVVRRRTRRLARLRLFVQLLIDKIVVMSGNQGCLRIDFTPNQDAGEFKHDVASRKGVVVIVSHLGSAEVMAAAPLPDGCRVHAYMRMENTEVFNRFYRRHWHLPSVEIKPLKGFGIGEALEAGGWLDEGDCVMMAGDRGYGRMVEVMLGDRPGRFPLGVFRLAANLEHRIYFAACVRSGRNRYRVHIRRARRLASLPQEFADFLAPLVAEHPDQWFNDWEDSRA
ncbi:MAG: hypothetical protein SPK06_06550 [Kiritimatiellia bacterium]|nr:hypothetical protein [Kiritimatiellia bacterium]